MGRTGRRHYEAPPTWRIDTEPVLGSPATVLWIPIFASDEPADVVIEAARRLPDVRFLIAGDVNLSPRELRAAAPPRVTFWVDEGYARLIHSADVRRVLTTEAASGPGGAVETIEGLRPPRHQRLPSLLPSFEDAVFVRNDPASIARGLDRGT
jgi:hypothetical protein